MVGDGSSPSPSLGTALSTRDNALNAVRLVLALFVILSHSLVIGRYTASGLPEWLTSTVGPLGGWAVRGFFAISGYLIVASRLHLSAPAYLWRRVLRIFPGYWVVLLVTAFVLAPLSVLLLPGSEYRLAAGWAYVQESAFLYRPAWEIEGTLGGLPQTAWNGSIWTLFYEFEAYFVVLIMFSIGWVRRHGAAVSAACLALTTILFPLMKGPLAVTTNLYLHSVSLASYFLAGVLLYFLRDRVPLRGWLLGTTCMVSALCVYMLPHAELYAQLPVALSVLMLGAMSRIMIGKVNDLSYGIYIYGMPMQQVAVLIGADRYGYLSHVLVSVALVLPCAAASWWLVEKPALSLKRLVPGRRRP
nr:acyltransferase [Actinomyces sp.]